MYLIGDIGNTEVKIFLISEKKKKLKKNYLKKNEFNYNNLVKKFKFIIKKRKQIKKIIFCSVVPQKYKTINFFLKKKLNISSIELKQINIKKMIKIKVNKKQIGSDRLANAISVINNKNNFIIVDFGTATNFDVVIKNQYIGGILAPGVQLSLNSLIEKASLIPKIDIAKISNVIGKNTKTAIRSGFYHGYTGLIDNIIKLIIKQSGKSFKIILTGGFAHLFKKSIKGKITINKNLTINGILKVASKLK